MWKGYDKKNGRLVAVKTPRSDSDESRNDSMSSDSLRSPLVKEQDYLQKIIDLQSGPDGATATQYVVQIYDYIPNPPALVMEFVEGGSVYDEILTSKFRLHESVVWRYAKDVLNGMQFLVLRNGGMVHGDINPKNFLISANGTIKLADFGSTVQYRELIRDNSIGNVASAQPIAGATHQYASRELLFGEISGPNLPSDMWSFGCSVLHMLTGKPPWLDAAGQPLGNFQVTQKLKAHTAPPIPAHCSRVLANLLARCFDYDNPTQRPIPSDLLNHPYFKAQNPDLTVMEKRRDFNEARRKHLNLPENDPILDQRGRRYYEPENSEFNYGERRRGDEEEPTEGVVQQGEKKGKKTPPPQTFVKEPSATEIGDGITLAISPETTWKFERNSKWERYSVSDSKIISRAFLEYQKFVASRRPLGPNDEEWLADGKFSFTHCWMQQIEHLQIDFNGFTQKVVGTEVHERLRPAPEEVTLVG